MMHYDWLRAPSNQHRLQNFSKFAIIVEKISTKKSAREAVRNYMKKRNVSSKLGHLRSF